MLTGAASMRCISLASSVPPLLPLLLLTIGGCRPTFAVGDTAAAARSELACDPGSRTFGVAANSSWQSVTVLAASQDFSGDCSILIDVQANVYNGTPSAGWSSPSLGLQPRQQQPGLLLKIENLHLGASSAACDYTANTLNIFVQNTTDQTGYICNVSTSAYMWASQAIKLYLYILSGSNSSAPYFTTAFLNVASPINICQQQLIANASSLTSAADLQIDSEAYVFAPDTRYSRVPPNNATCASDTNYTLTIAANGSMSSAALNITVLAAPPNGSCWSLLLNGQRRRSGDALSVAAGGRSTLVYARDGGGSANPGDCVSSLSSGFTLTATVVVTATTTIAPTTATTATATNITTSSATVAPASSTVAGSLPSGPLLIANSTVAAFSVATSTASKVLQSTTVAAASQNTTATGSSWATYVSTNGLNGTLYLAGTAAGSSQGGTTAVSLLAVAVGCSVAGGVVIAAAACAVAALLAACRNSKHRGRARKANLYSTDDANAGRSKPTAPIADGSHNLAYSTGSDTDF